MKRCVGIQFLNGCEYAVLLANGYGCRSQGECEFQRPREIKTEDKPDIHPIMKEALGPFYPGEKGDQ